MKRFEIRLSKELHENLREESFITGKSMHEIVIELIEEHYKMKLVELNEGTRTELASGTTEIVEYLKPTRAYSGKRRRVRNKHRNIKGIRCELNRLDLGW